MTTINDIHITGQHVHLKCNNCGFAMTTVAEFLSEGLSMGRNYDRNMRIEEIAHSTRCGSCGSNKVISKLAEPKDLGKPAYFIGFHT